LPYSYPPAAPTLSGDFFTVSRFLNDPVVVARRLRTLAEQRLIATAILSGRETVSGGAIGFEQNETMYPDRVVESVSPGGEYPMTPISTGPAQLAKIVKWGQDTIVTDEAVSRQRMQAAERAMLKLVNAAAKNVDSVALSLIASSVTQTRAASATWSSATPKILQDIMLAKADIAALNQGYDPNTLIINDATWAYVASDPTLINAMQRETTANPVYTGSFQILAGLRVLPTPNLPAAGAWVLDSAQLGGIATEDLQGGYESAGDLLQSKSIREDHTDQWRLRARAVFVPYITEPNAAVKITGV
jgi:hypothetical protein